MEPLISACNDLKIKAIELQHGVLNNYHMGYSFPVKSVAYFPDEILFFGDSWHEDLKIPLPKSKRISRGYDYLNYQKKIYGDFKKTKDSILILPSGNNTLDIVFFLKKFILNNKKYKISIKFHPSEYLGWEKKYPEILMWKNDSVIQVVKNLDDNLHSILAQNEIVIGVSSAALYEALVFNCQCFVLNLPGWEHLENLINKDLITKIDFEIEVENKIQNRLQKKNEPDRYFTSVLSNS